MSADTGIPRGAYQVLTSPGPAAIAVIRARGAAVERFLSKHVRLSQAADKRRETPGQVLRGELLDSDETPLDDILLTTHAAPPSWDVRLHLHGSPWLVRRCTELLAACGLVERQESTATLWPAVDELEAEAYALLPRMLTLRGARWLLRQVTLLRQTIERLTQEHVLGAAQQECRAIAQRIELVDWFLRPLRVVLIGPPNSGKSTLINALADRQVCLVSPTPGTTRDWVDVPGEANGLPVVWMDTAGLRAGADALETVSIARTRTIMAEADAVVPVLDAVPEATADRHSFCQAYGDINPACVALNKIDLVESAAAAIGALPESWRARTAPISALYRTGLDEFTDRLLAGVGRASPAPEQPAPFTRRQAEHWAAAAEAPNLGELQAHLQQILGSTTDSDVC